MRINNISKIDSFNTKRQLKNKNFSDKISFKGQIKSGSCYYGTAGAVSGTYPSSLMGDHKSIKTIERINVPCVHNSETVPFNYKIYIADINEDDPRSHMPSDINFLVEYIEPKMPAYSEILEAYENKDMKSISFEKLIEYDQAKEEASGSYYHSKAKQYAKIESCKDSIQNSIVLLDQHASLAEQASRLDAMVKKYSFITSTAQKPINSEYHTSYERDEINAQEALKKYRAKQIKDENIEEKLENAKSELQEVQAALKTLEENPDFQNAEVNIKNKINTIKNIYERTFPGYMIAKRHMI